MLIRGDALHLPLADASVQTVVTSPPYLRQRLYGNSPHEGGREESLAEYVTWLADVFEEVRRVLHPTGHAWLNIGDKANGSGGAGGDWTRDRPDPGLGARQQRERGPGKFLDPDYAEATYLDVPGAVVAELTRRGWRLRAPIVWDKLRDAPESLDHVKRPRFRHEMIYLLAPHRRQKKRTDPRPKFFPSMLEDTGTVWRFRAGGNGDPHLAPFPDELARRCILPTTLPGDLVLDPFDGSGTTRRVAIEHGRRGVGVDLYAGLDTTTLGATSPRDARRRTGSTRADTVSLTDLRAVNLRPAVFYRVLRQLTDGATLETLTVEHRLTPDQVDYVDRITKPDPLLEGEATA